MCTQATGTNLTKCRLYHAATSFYFLSDVISFPPGSLQLVQDSYTAGEIDEDEKGKLKRHIIGQALQDEGVGVNPMDAVMGSDDNEALHDEEEEEDDGEGSDNADDDLSDCEQGR